MKLFYGGAETRAWKALLAENNIPAVAMSYVGLRTLSEADKQLDYNGEVFLDSGAYTYNKRQEEYQFEDVLEIAAQYMDFIKDNISKVSLVSEFDAVQLGTEYIYRFREDFYNNLPAEKFMPVWHPENGNSELERLCSAYAVVGVSQADIHGDTERVPVFNSYINRYGVRLHGVGITSKKLIEAVKWDSVSSISWLSPSMYGDTFVWTGRELKRYPKAYKDRARKSHRNIFMDHGFDYEKIEADDNTELLRLSLWSWEQYIKSISGVTTPIRNEIAGTGEMTSPVVGTSVEKIGTRRSTISLPIMETIFKEDQNDEENTDAIPHLIIRSESMRVCDTCFLRDKCPGFQAQSTCLYNIPIEIRTKEQLRSLHDALIEMQTHRVLFMKMAEDLSGGYADPNLSSEIDRLNRMIKTKIEGDKSTFSATLNIEAPSGPGFVERMFGSSAASKLAELDAPVIADDLIKDSEVYDAEIVES